MSEEKPKNTSAPDNRTGAYILIGLGVVFLLVNVLNINFSRLWPLVLVAIGVYMLIGREGFGSAGVKKGHYRAPVDDARSADVELHLSVGEARVETLAAGSDLIDADLTYVGDIHFDVSGAENKVVRLRQTADSTWQWINPATWFNGGGKYDWRIGLTPKIPMRLNIRGGLGQSELNLRHLNVTDLRLSGGAGQMKVMLPASEAGYDARFEGGLGQADLDIPPSTSMTLELRGGVGQINVDLPIDVAVRLRAKGGVGDVKVPSRLVQVRASNAEFELGKSGEWESADFESADHRITINYEGGVGELRVR